MQEFIAQLELIVGKSSILLRENDYRSYAADWRGRYVTKPLAVVLPSTVNQISSIVKLCQKYKVGIVPQGGNTSLCGGAVPNIPNFNSKAQIIVNLRNLNQILEINSIEQYALVEAGCILQNLQQTVLAQNLYFPLSIAAEGSCQIGGNIATNAGGIHVVKYGMMRNLVLGLEVILPDGSIVNQLNGLVKNNTNFDLKQIFIGSEGTLGIITRAKLKLYAKPSNYITCLVGIDNLTRTTYLLNQLQTKFSICAFEIIHRSAMDIYNQAYPQTKLSLTNCWIILFELEVEAEFNIDTLIHIISQKGINLDQAVIADNHSERQRLWQIRENIPLAEKKAGFAIKHDIALPISKIDEFIKVNQDKIKKLYPEAQLIIFGHLGDGNLHYNVCFPNQDLTYLETREENINRLVYDDVYAYGGTFSAEHGIGQLKTKWFERYYDPTSYKTAQAIKQLLDPNNLLNPGKIFN
jgi:FAD/FMN-containing dehydrogenase